MLVCDGAPMFPVGVLHGVRYKGGDVPLQGRYEDIPASSYAARGPPARPGRRRRQRRGALPNHCHAVLHDRGRCLRRGVRARLQQLRRRLLRLRPRPVQGHRRHPARRHGRRRRRVAPVQGPRARRRHDRCPPRRGAPLPRRAATTRSGPPPKRCNFRSASTSRPSGGSTKRHRDRRPDVLRLPGRAAHHRRHDLRRHVRQVPRPAVRLRRERRRLGRPSHRAHGLRAGQGPRPQLVEGPVQPADPEPLLAQQRPLHLHAGPDGGAGPRRHRCRPPDVVVGLPPRRQHLARLAEGDRRGAGRHPRRRPAQDPLRERRRPVRVPSTSNGEHAADRNHGNHLDRQPHQDRVQADLGRQPPDRAG